MTKNMSILLILLASSNLMAQGTSSAKKDEGVKTGAKPSKDWSISISNSTTSNLYKTDNPDHYADNITGISLGLKAGPGKLRLSGSIYKPLTDGERKEKAGDIGLSYGQKLGSINKFTTVSGALKMTLPVSENSRERSELTTAFTLSTPVSWDATQAGLKGAYVSYAPFVKKNFHEYEIATTGASNREWIVGNSLGLGYSLTDWMSIDFSGSYSRSITYQGNSTDVYSLDQSVSFSLPKKMGLSLGHQIGGSPLAPNGRDTQIDLFDSKKATVYATLSISI